MSPASVAPAVLEAPLAVLGIEPRHRLVGDEIRAGVDEAGRLLAAGSVLGHRIDAHRRHLVGELHHRGGNDPGLDVAHAGAAAVDRGQDHVLFLAERFQRLIATGRRRLVDGVDDVDVAILGEQVLHADLALVLRAVGDGGAGDGRIAFGNAEALQEAIEASSSSYPAEKAMATKKLDVIRKTIKELEDYERDTLYPLATRQIEIDLDDGVKANYPKFGTALKKIPGLDAKED